MGSEMIRIYGYSDDTLIIEGSEKYEEIGCFNNDVRIEFEDGSEAMFHYGKEVRGETLGIWSVDLRNRKTTAGISICYVEDTKINSDILWIFTEIKSVEKIEL